MDLGLVGHSTSANGHVWTCQRRAGVRKVLDSLSVTMATSGPAQEPIGNILVALTEAESILLSDILIGFINTFVENYFSKTKLCL